MHMFLWRHDHVRLQITTFMYSLAGVSFVSKNYWAKIKLKIASESVNIAKYDGIKAYV